MDNETLIMALGEVINDALAQLRAGMLEDLKALLNPEEPKEEPAPAPPEDINESLEQRIEKMITAQNAKLDKALNRLSLNFSEQGSNPANPKPSSPGATVTLESVKKKTGLTGAAAAIAYLNAQNQ